MAMRKYANANKALAYVVIVILTSLPTFHHTLSHFRLHTSLLLHLKMIVDKKVNAYLV